jgi:hypothetical protein
MVSAVTHTGTGDVTWERPPPSAKVISAADRERLESDGEWVTGDFQFATEDLAAAVANVDGESGE